MFYSNRESDLALILIPRKNIGRSNLIKLLFEGLAVPWSDPFDVVVKLRWLLTTSTQLINLL